VLKTKASLSRSDTVTLVDLCRQGDEHAWRVLVERYENLVYSTALGTGLDREAASEVHQRVWVELHRSLHRLRDPQALPKWLIVTARRLSYEQSVRSAKQVVDLSDELVDPSPSSDTSIEKLQESQLVHQALRRMRGRCHQLLQMLFFEDPRPAYRDVADRLGVAVGTLGSMRSRCLARLRELMEEST